MSPADSPTDVPDAQLRADRPAEFLTPETASAVNA